MNPIAFPQANRRPPEGGLWADPRRRRGAAIALILCGIDPDFEAGGGGIR